LSRFRCGRGEGGRTGAAWRRVTWFGVLVGTGVSAAGISRKSLLIEDMRSLRWGRDGVLAGGDFVVRDVCCDSLLCKPMENWIDAVSVGTFGLFWCFTLWRTGTLWFAIGFHAMSDYADMVIFAQAEYREPRAELVRAFAERELYRAGVADGRSAGDRG